MKKRKAETRSPMLRRLLAAAGVSVLVVAGGLVVYLWNLSNEIEQRFSGRRWSIPSRVLSDTLTLYPGQPLARERFVAKLGRLGYRKMDRSPERPGESWAAGQVVEVYLRRLQTPHHARDGFPLQVRFQKERIESMTRTDTKEPVPLLELEPEELMLFFGPERKERRLVSLSEVPNHLVHAVMAAEDARFFEHPGMDVVGIMRAAWSNIRHRALKQGGSTITQQLAKNYFLTPERTLSRKVKELMISLAMEATNSKAEILEIYLNEIYLGNKGSVSVNGIGEASFFYFGKPVKELTVAESATLAGLIRAPNGYSPFVNRARSRQRRDTVLRSMHGHGWISKQELDGAIAEPVKTVEYETYAKQAPYFMDYLSQQLLTLYSAEDLSRLGLSIYTTLDADVQRAAEQALETGLSRLEKNNPALLRQGHDKRLQGAVVVLQPRTGYVLAMVGGRKYGESQFNRITQARRQPGSAFKPFVYLAALESHTPATMLSNEDKAYWDQGKEWRPDNFTPIPETRISMRAALAKSVNRATADLAVRMGVDPIIMTATAFGFTTALPPYPSICLGSAEVVPLELARAYCAFAADGVLPQPVSMKEVVSEEGETLERRQLTVSNATSPQKAFLLTSMLRSVTETGTARSIRNLPFPVAGKTGTTNDFKDAWFVGYTPEILALVWVGFDDGTSVHASGSTAALPIFTDLLKAIPQHASGGWFHPPEGVVEATICTESGELADPNCPTPAQEYFLVENAPREVCRTHSDAQLPGKDGFQQLFQNLKDFFRMR